MDVGGPDMNRDVQVETERNSGTQRRVVCQMEGQSWQKRVMYDPVQGGKASHRESGRALEDFHDAGVFFSMRAGGCSGMLDYVLSCFSLSRRC